MTVANQRSSPSQLAGLVCSLVGVKTSSFQILVTQIEGRPSLVHSTRSLLLPPQRHSTYFRCFVHCSLMRSPGLDWQWQSRCCHSNVRQSGRAIELVVVLKAHCPDIIRREPGHRVKRIALNVGAGAADDPEGRILRHRRRQWCEESGRHRHRSENP